MPNREPIDYQPTLGWWGHLWRLLAAVAWLSLAHWQWNHDIAWFWTDLATGLACLIVMQYRRRRPVLVVVVTILCGLFSASSAGAATLVLASLATRRRGREVVPLTLASLAQAIAFETYEPTASGPWLVTATAAVTIVGVTVATGMYIGSRRELLATLKQRADTAESEQSSRIAQARTAERARIAREMHDVLAHRISLVAMHAGALAYRTDLSAGEVRTASGVIQDNAHQALTDLREVLGILRDDPLADAPNRPQPTWPDIPVLITEAQSSGMNVTYENTVDSSALPERTGRTAFRIVQEGLTNARKHAPDTSVRVEILDDEGLVVRVRNPLRIGDRRTSAPVSGLGLIGLTERTALSGGTLTHRITDDQEFVLSARLPWST